MNLASFKRAFPYTIPVLMGYVPLGIAFGILLGSQGYAYYWSTLMGMIIYAGSMQFLAVGLLTQPVNLAVTAFITFTVNARHLFYGLSMTDIFPPAGAKKWYMIFALTDETYSLLCGINPPGDLPAEDFYFSLSLLNQLYWVVGCTIGGLLGNMMKFDVRGIDFAMTALFLVIFLEQWLSTDNHVPALSGVFVTLTCLLFLGKQNFIIASMAGICLIFLYLKRLEERREDGVK